MQNRTPINWESPLTKQSLLDLQETIFLQGRDSRVVRSAFAYSRLKKQGLARVAQGWRGLTQKQKKPSDHLRIFFWLPGGIGDAACARRLVSAYLSLMPGAEAEIYSPVTGAVETIFAGLKGIKSASCVKQYWGNYDLVVFACLGVKFLASDENRLAKLAPEFLPTYTQAKSAQAQLGFLLEDPFLTEPALGRWLRYMGGKRFDLLSFTGGIDLTENRTEKIPVDLSKLASWGLTPHNYLTFHDASQEEQLATRMWPREHWEALLQKIKEQYPTLKIVQLGTRDNPAYLQADICLCGKTILSDLPSLLEGSLLHVDTESGLVHLAQYLSTKSVVLFGPSEKNFFAYQKNINLAAGECGGCMWSVPNWMNICALSKGEASCLRAITPLAVWQAMEPVLKGQNR